MKDMTHVVVSVGVGLLCLSILNLFMPMGLLFFFFGFLFALLGHACDWLDFKIFREHKRNFLTHSPLSPLLILIAFILGTLISLADIILGIYIGVIVYLIFFLHFLLDSLNPSGVPLLPKSRIHILEIPFDDWKWNLLIILAGVGTIVSAFLIYSLSL